MPPKPLFALASIAFAFLLPLALGWQSHRAQMSGDEIRVRVEAYDPRDLLHGHYLTFRIRWPLAADRAATPAPACLCMQAGTIDPPVAGMACDAARQDGNCHAVLSGKDFGGDNFDIGINRYYVDERYATALESLIRRQRGPDGRPVDPPPEETFRISLTPLAGGKAVVRGLYIGDLPLADYLGRHGERLLAPESPRP